MQLDATMQNGTNLLPRENGLREPAAQRSKQMRGNQSKRKPKISLPECYIDYIRKGPAQQDRVRQGENVVDISMTGQIRVHRFR